MHRDRSFCAKSVRYNIFTNGAPYQPVELCCGMNSKQEDLKRSIHEEDSSSRVTDVVLVMRGG